MNAVPAVYVSFSPAGILESHVVYTRVLAEVC